MLASTASTSATANLPRISASTEPSPIAKPRLYGTLPDSIPTQTPSANTPADTRAAPGGNRRSVINPNNALAASAESASSTRTPSSAPKAGDSSEEPGSQ